MLQMPFCVVVVVVVTVSQSMSKVVFSEQTNDKRVISPYTLLQQWQQRHHHPERIRQLCLLIEHHNIFLVLRFTARSLKCKAFLWHFRALITYCKKRNTQQNTEIATGYSFSLKKVTIKKKIFIVSNKCIPSIRN